MTKILTSFAGLPAHTDDYVIPAGSFGLDGINARGQVWRRVFRSRHTLFAAAKAEQAAMAEMGAEGTECDLSAYRVIGSGADGRTEPVRI